MTDMHRVALLGFGTMGAGIAQLIAQSERHVTVLETDEARAQAGLAALDKSLVKGVERGKLDQRDRQDVLSRVRAVTDISELSDADLVIEAVTEQADVKSELLARVAAVTRHDAIIVTNTSALSVTDLAASVVNPERFAGLHFFNPAPMMKIIEVVRALQTDDDVIDRLVALVESLGKTAIVVKDRPGFLVNWLLMPYLNDVVQALDDDLASAEDIDIALKLGLGYKLGPLELLDMMGLDVNLHATTSAYEATLDPRFAPPPLLKQMVAAGRLGTKSGHGFRTDEGER